MASFPSQRPRSIEKAGAILSSWIVCLWGLGCSRVVSLPEVDLTDPQWTVWEGQALWKPRSDLPALAGDLIVARNGKEDVLISFSKSPIPIFTAQKSGRFWRIDFVEQGKSYSGIGRPPKRFVWFRLPALLEGASAPKHWEVEEVAEDDWSMSNRRTGETIRVVLDR